MDFVIFRLPFGMPEAFETTRAPVPPTSLGLPTPNLNWVSFALRVGRVDCGSGLGSESDSSVGFCGSTIASFEVARVEGILVVGRCGCG